MSRGVTRGYKGRYKPKHPEKYIGNVKNIIFRSLAERKMMVYLDESEQCTKWNSEELAIPYFSEVDHKMHRYYPDFYVEMIDTNLVEKKYIIEMKPKFQIDPPKNSRSKYYLKECETYIINQCKWKAASAFCEEQGIEFKIMAI